MSYPNLDGDGADAAESQESAVEDLLRRKEFYALRADPVRDFKDPPVAAGALFDEGEEIALLKKHLRIHSHQLFDGNFMSPDTPYKRLHLLNAPGTGKCHAADTPILMYDGAVRPAKSIAVGDKLMGDDSTPRTVLSVARGREKMWRVDLEDGSNFVCNESHILTLRCDDMLAASMGGRVIDISIRDIRQVAAAAPSFWRHCFAFKTAVRFGRETGVAPPACEAGLDRVKPGAVTPASIRFGPPDVRAALLDELLGGLGEAAERCDGDVFIDRQKTRRDLIEEIIFVARSIGVWVDEGPTVIVRWSNRRDIHAMRFALVELPANRYYGFSIDGNRRYVLGNFAVTHNTLAAIYVASKFIKVYNRIYQTMAAKMQLSRKNYGEIDRGTPTVFVLGFGGTKSAFVRDLLKYPDFGFISVGEREELTRRRKAADSGFPDDIKHYRDYHAYLKRRITNKTKGGFFKFYGYDEFVNRLFLSDKDVKLTDLEVEAINRMRAGETTAEGRPVTLDDVLKENIASGKVQINTTLLDMFKDSLLICDEVHNTYNMNMKNNRGVAIQYILDTVPNMRFLSLSATPINNSPTEIVELINYLVPGRAATKREFFKDSRTLHPGKLEEIGRLLTGRVSFLQDTNIQYYPRREMMGQDLVLQHDVNEFRAGAALPYLKFIQCEMSEFHSATYWAYVDEAGAGSKTDAKAGSKTEPLEPDDDDAVDNDQVLGMSADLSHRPVPTDGYSIYDIAFPNPDNPAVGLFRSADTRTKINAGSQGWRDKVGIYVKKQSQSSNLITGSFLARENIGTYSTKYLKILDLISGIIAESGGDPARCQKIMIYHDRVRMSGVLLIQELLLANGYIGETSEPVDDTVCCICGVRLKDHGGASAPSPPPHDFRPVRFVMAHSDVDKTAMTASIEKYIAPENANGLNFMILVGSKIIKESYDLKDIQNVIIASLPVNIPTLIQVLGRSIRKESHINLPVEQRRVRIYIVVSTAAPRDRDKVSPEVYRYADKLSNYAVIQLIEREINRCAIDGPIHRDIIMSAELLKEYFPADTATIDKLPLLEAEKQLAAREPVAGLGNLYFKPAIDLPAFEPAGEAGQGVRAVNTTTFVAYNHYEDEIHIITRVIKRLFMTQRVWKYEDLWRAVREPPVALEVNPRFFGEDNFIIALHHLVSKTPSIIQAKSTANAESLAIEKIFNFAEKHIWVGGQKHKIDQIGEYYVLFPIADVPQNPMNVVLAEYIEKARDRDLMLVKTARKIDDRIIIDVETYIRPMRVEAGLRLSVDEFLRANREAANHQLLRAEFVQKHARGEYAGPDDYLGFLVEYPTVFQMKMLEEAIASKWKKGGGDQAVLDGIIELFDQFKVLIYTREVRKYRDAVKQFKEGIRATAADTVPIGYMSAKSVRLYDAAEDKWFEMNKVALNRQVVHKENEIIVGVLETVGDKMKFKLRKPIQKIRQDVQAANKRRAKREKKAIAGKAIDEATGPGGDDGGGESDVIGVEDTRLIERGIVCTTKSKYELLKILAQLGVSVGKLDKKDTRIKRLCALIKQSLVRSELRERAKDSRYKYLYGWWDEQPLAAQKL